MKEDKTIVYMICNDKQIKMTRDVFDYLMTVKHYNKKLKEEIIKLQQNYNKLQDDYQEQYTYEYNLRKQLQHDLEKANDIIEKDRQFYKCRMDEYVELKKENEFLKLNNPEMNIEHFRIVKENKRKIDNLRKENERLKEDNLLIKSANKLVSDNLHNYKSRCKKAIKYIKSTNCYGMRSGKTLLQKYLHGLLNILNGSDENV